MFSWDPEGFLDFLLQNRCGIDYTDLVGCTALFEAACDGHENAMRRLLERGEDPLAVCEAETVLSVAAREKHVGAVKLILRVFDERGLDLGEVEGALEQAQGGIR